MIKVVDIVWLTNGEDADLPSEVTIEETKIDKDVDLKGYAEEVTNYLSDTYGFLTVSYRILDEEAEEPAEKEDTLTGVLIRDMTMPRICIDEYGWYGHCPLDRTWCAQRYAPKNYTMGQIYEDQKGALPKWCPLVDMTERERSK